MAKVLVSMDDRLLKRLDRAAQSQGKSRSAYLADLAEADSLRQTGQGKTPGARAALSRLDELFADSPSGDSTDLIREDRDRH
ncbi:MAG: type II toxin-antitoxin system HicB family antitoxin [Solirubrobacterales bacterium]|nr:type II toxin-antitoxin system HicB family antitoxin [Solirubrobacterales bacterium]